MHQPLRGPRGVVVLQLDLSRMTGPPAGQAIYIPRHQTFRPRGSTLVDGTAHAAGVALAADDLPNLPFALGSAARRGRCSAERLRQPWYRCLLMPATIFGLGIGPAVAVHEGSTLLVVFNVLRLLAYREPTPQ